jgi:hypothetical protein
LNEQGRCQDASTDKYNERFAHSFSYEHLSSLLFKNKTKRSFRQLIKGEGRWLYGRLVDVNHFLFSFYLPGDHAGFTGKILTGRLYDDF